MYGYILIDKDNIIVSYKSLTSKIEDDEYIYIGMDLNLNDLLYRKYDIKTNAFSDEKYLPIIEQMPTWEEEMEKKISILEQNNQELREELTQIQTSIASLTSLITATLEEK